MAYIDDFKARFPEFDTAIVDASIPLLEPVLHCYYGAEYGARDCDDEVLLQLGAHLLVMSNKAGSGALKGVDSRSVDGVSVSYSSAGGMNKNDLFFSGSKYGQQYLALTRKNNGGFFV